ncbi:ABC transporter ATP-binding protein [Candidatus Roizmanbacteria bacterium]|nr:ABC transporter ATP-binding protein [Candidatus Roizmanbacteria bacterium]
MANIISLKNIHKTYGSGESVYEALKGVTLDIQEGEMVAIMGPSGSGKSTLMNIIGLLDSPTSGQYVIEDKDTNNLNDDQMSELRNQTVGFIFQSFNLLNRISVLENVQRPMVYGGISSGENKKRALDNLEKVGLLSKADSFPTQLSGGQIQRVAIARALVMNPAIILADEPTGNLDTANSAQVMKLLCNINKQGNTVIIVTHSDEIASYAERKIVIRDGLISNDIRI